MTKESDRILDIAMEWVWMVLDAGLMMLAQPFYYISVILIGILYRRQVLLERKLFHVRVNGWQSQTLRTMLGGLVAGLGVSVMMAFLGITLTMSAVLCLWAASLLLMLFRVRFLCFAYAAGLLGIVQSVLGWFPGWQPDGWLGSVHTALLNLNVPSLLALAAVLHLAEAGLVMLQGGRFASPLFLEGKRGKLVGGYQMQSFWPLPLFLLVPSAGGPMLPWTPFFGGDDWMSGAGIAALPVLIGFGEMTQSMLPKQKAVISGKRLVIYSSIVLMLSLLADWWPPLMLAAALAAPLLHEGLAWYSRYEEQQRSPLFVHPPKGLKVLAVLPGSPAEELGILAGETILKVNGTLVRSKEQLHAALRQNAAFCKLEVQNYEGESKFMQRAMYAGEHHQLGVILSPDPDAGLAVRLKPLSIAGLLGMKWSLKNKMAAEEEGAETRTPAGKGSPAAAGLEKDSLDM
ncbi:cell division topological determinant [Paenibacillus algicola]|uniref:Cell division topological determinant n=1 Tax=Paenibacillus algicola TaxID=2565926 RepID=A0A4P8XPU8_9BACL|nr:PDZ domain-containing protein [Paenibacillus algicola]QCT04523.1 cell division topological determinant [Paenibacillus algicola]